VSYVIFDNKCKRAIRHTFREIISKKGERDVVEPVEAYFFLMEMLKNTIN
jgi:hypothetical protein